MTTKLSLTKNIGKISGIAPEPGYENPQMEQGLEFSKKMADEVNQGNKTPTIEEISPPQSQPTPSIGDQLKALREQRLTKKREQEVQMTAQPNAQTEKPIDYDAEPHGFDNSDKMSMLGSVFLGGAVGLSDMLMGAEQLLGRAASTSARLIGKLPGVPEENYVALADYFAGAVDRDTNWYDRNVSRRNLVKNARASHPVVFELGKLGSNIASTAYVLKGMSMLSAGEELIGASGEAVKDVIAATERIGGKGSFVKAMGTAVKNAAAKSVINARKTITPSKLADWVGEGVAFNELQYDPENNHYIASDALAGAAALAFGGAGKLIGGMARPLADEIAKTSKEFGVQLPIYPTLEKIAKWLPMSGYGKLITERSKQVFGLAKGVKAKITGEATTVIGRDIEKRSAELKGLLQDEAIPFHQRKIYEDQLGSLQKQKEQLGTTPGFSQFLFGKSEQHLSQARKTYSEMDSKIVEKLKNTPDVDTTKLVDIANEIVNQEEGINKSLRRNTLLRISADIAGKESSNEMKAIFSQMNITNPSEIADYMEGLLNGKLYVQNPEIYRALAPHQSQIADILHATGVPHGSVDKADVALLMNAPSMSPEELRMHKTRVGQKLGDATNSYDKGKFKRLYGALQSAYEGHINKYGDEETLKLFRESNRLYHDTVKPLEHIIDEYSSGSSKNADNFIWKFLKPDEPNATSDLLKLMPKNDNTATLALKAANLHEAYDRAYLKGIGLNPVKYVNEALKLGETNKSLYTESEMNTFKGYQELVNRIERISPDALVEGVAEGWPSGKEASTKLWKERGVKSTVAAALGGIGLTMGKGFLAPLFLTSYGFGKLSTSKAGRNILEGFAKLGKNAKEETVNPLVKEAVKYLGFYPIIEGAHKLISNMNNSGKQ